MVTLTKSFVVGSNNPGFLPEDTDTVEDFDTARQLLVETIERAYDDVEADESFLEWLEGRITLARTASGPIDIMIEGRIYFIQAAE